MAVYVDEIREHGGSKTFRWPRSCHMYADTLEELHAMAVAIGMMRAWFQGERADFPHYDLVPARRLNAIQLGALQKDKYHAVEFARSRRAADATPSLFGGEEG
jgi:hypothetical protein